MRRLALFARRPRAGEVKTRLSPAVPGRIACDLYRAMLEDAIAAMSAAEADERFLYWAESPKAGDGAAAVPEIAPAAREGAGPTGAIAAPAGGLDALRGVPARAQQGGHLGERMERAFHELLEQPGDLAVILGADCPALEPRALDDAFDALGTHDLVLGPARDGGYYLVGLRRRAPSIFRDIEWGTSGVLDGTLAHAARAGLTAALLPALDDIDTPEDLLRWIALRAGGGGPDAPRALDRALSAIGLLPPR